MGTRAKNDRHRRYAGTMTPSGSPIRVIVVSPSPDGSIRDSELATFVRTMHLRIDTRVDAVFLLDGPSAEHWRKCCSHLVVLDDARTWPVAQAVERLGKDGATNQVRGARLTWLLSELGTYDLAILDQGLGADVLDRLGCESAVVVARWTADGPTECAGRTPVATADVVLDEQRGGAPISGPSQPWTLGFDPEPGWLAALDVRRAETRARLGVDDDRPLVIGIGDAAARSQFVELSDRLAGVESAWAPDDDAPIDVIAAGDVVIGCGDQPLDRAQLSAAWAAGALTVCDLTDASDQTTGAAVSSERNPALLLARGVTLPDAPHPLAEQIERLLAHADDNARRRRAADRVPDRDWIANQLFATANQPGRTRGAPTPLDRSFRERVRIVARRVGSR